MDEGDNTQTNTQGEKDPEVQVGDEGVGVEEEQESSERISDVLSQDNKGEGAIAINVMVDILKVDMENINMDDVGMYDFYDL